MIMQYWEKILKKICVAGIFKKIKYNEQLSSGQVNMLDEIIKKHYHCCPEWDYKIICEDDVEYRACLCEKLSKEELIKLQDDSK